MQKAKNYNNLKTLSVQKLIQLYIIINMTTIGEKRKIRDLFTNGSNKQQQEQLDTNHIYKQLFLELTAENTLLLLEKHKIIIDLEKEMTAEITLLLLEKQKLHKELKSRTFIYRFKC
jgi:hypothetical protein